MISRHFTVYFFVNCNWCTISGGNIFRHLLIGELGKKFNAIVMGVISAILFSLMHVMGAESPLEIGSYLILAIAMVYAYIKSGFKLIASVSIHMLNNLISFVLR